MADSESTLTNILSASELSGLARQKAREYTTKTVAIEKSENEVKNGWVIEREGKETVRLRKNKVLTKSFPDRVWSLFYQMGFPYLSSQDEGLLRWSGEDAKSPLNKIDVVAIDEEVGIAIECKTAERPGRRPQFQEELGKVALIHRYFSSGLNNFAAQKNLGKLQPGVAFFTHNIILSDQDKERARQVRVPLFDEQDLSYYERLVAHIGSAARFQFFADFFPDRAIPGLKLRVPAIQAKMGKYSCYTFAISPEHLLKIAYVAHRAKGKASDIDTYQRMVEKPRLRKIRDYILDNGIFPTNIVVNFTKSPQFNRSSQEGSLEDSGIMGWLDIQNIYKSAWIIDGQHRLFAYAGLQRALNSRLSVVAFDNLPASEQAELFVRINGEQKRVKKSLLQDLFAELHWDSAKTEERIAAVISRAMRSLDEDYDSPFHNRIQSADESKEGIRCISLTSMFKALHSSDLYIAATRRNITVPGPLWGGNDNNDALKRTIYAVKFWFSLIREAVPEWWALGSEPGGGLAMNDGVVALIGVLRSVFAALEAKGERLAMHTERNLMELTRPYGEAAGIYLASFSEEQRKGFRDLRGAQGHTIRMRRIQQAIHQQIPSFTPSGLEEFTKQELANTNDQAQVLIERIEASLRETVIDELRSELGSDESQWWADGVPTNVRASAALRFEKDNRKRGVPEKYLELLDFQAIIRDNWSIFQMLLGFGKGSKEKRTAWISTVNDLKKIVTQAAAGKAVKPVSFEQIAALESYDLWISDKRRGLENVSSEDAEDVE